jgi:ubiquinol-cytochrome c reductase cytochrome b subunit
VPSFDLTIAGYTLVPNPFWGGALFPLIVFGFLALWPLAERRWITQDYGYHNLLDRPRDAPLRTAIGLGMFAWVSMIFVAGGLDRVTVMFDVDYVTMIWVFRVAIWVVPVVVGVIAHRVCVELQHGEEEARVRKRAEHRAKALAETTDII